jgi:hypothetical protein
VTLTGLMHESRPSTARDAAGNNIGDYVQQQFAAPERETGRSAPTKNAPTMNAITAFGP